MLRRNLAANAVDAEVVEAAVGSRGGHGVLHEPGPGSWASRVVAPGSPAPAALAPLPSPSAPAEGRTVAPAQGPEEGLAVAMVAMQDLLARAGPGPVVAKLDCEGAEYDIVAGTPPTAWLPVCAVLVEYHPVPGTGGWPWLAGSFGDMGFALAWHAPDRRVPGQGLACFTRVPLAPLPGRRGASATP